MSKKILFIAFLLSANFTFAGDFVNGIVSIVENEPITAFEVQKAMNTLNLDEKQALNLIINEKLSEAEIKNLNISVTNFEIAQRLENIAKQRGIAPNELESALLANGIDFADFKSDVEKNLQKEKLYEYIFSEAKINISEGSARAFFEANLDEFSIFSRIKTTRYISPSKEFLDEIKISPFVSNKAVKTEAFDLSVEQIPAELNEILNATPNGQFTGIFKTPLGFEMFFVAEKSGAITPRFEDVRQDVLNKIYKLEEERVLNDYFNKLRAKANIQTLR